jgi:His/Glu/Gln/Arg/opine family amino acid ABC transporter permease subunit
MSITMNTIVPTAPAPTRPPPSTAAGPIAWARDNLFGGIASSAVSIIIGAIILFAVYKFVDWGIIHAMWNVPHDAAGVPQTGVCISNAGACWAVIHEKWQLILYGLYPSQPTDERWRPAVVIILFLFLYGISAAQPFWQKQAPVSFLPILAWVAVLALGAVLSVLNALVHVLPAGFSLFGLVGLGAGSAFVWAVILTLPLGLILSAAMPGRAGLLYNKVAIPGYLWLACLTAIGVLMAGGMFGLPAVPEDLWGGLPITLILSTFGLALAFPIAIVVALARRSHLPGLPICYFPMLLLALHIVLSVIGFAVGWDYPAVLGFHLGMSMAIAGAVVLSLLIGLAGFFLAPKLEGVLFIRVSVVKLLSVCYVELIRGVPLISLLFMAHLMFPLFMPQGWDVDELLRAQVAIMLFAGAYLAEVVRGGLTALPKGQYEAADALGLSYFKKTGLIVLPQALRLVIPPLVNTFIGFFKDTSLVSIIGMFDLMMTAHLAVQDAPWQAFWAEVYIFIGVIYFCFCYAMAYYSRTLEAQFNKAKRR